MNRYSASELPRYKSVPRACGDEPYGADRIITATVRSPRMRG